MLKKTTVVFLILALQVTAFLGLSTANQNHGQYVSDVAKDTEPGPDHGKIVSEAARSKLKKEKGSASNYSLSLDGVNDTVVIPHNDLLNLKTNFAIETWVKLEPGYLGTTVQGYPGYHPVPIVTKHSSGWWNGYMLYLPDLHFYLAHTYTISSQYAGINDGYWHHVAATGDSSSVKLFIDGALDSQTFASNNDYTMNDMPLLIGSILHWNGRIDYLKAQVDETRIWNKTLTQAEIQANMNKEIQPQAGLVGYWKFNEGTGNVATDSSGNGNHGTLINGPAWTTETPF